MEYLYCDGKMKEKQKPQSNSNGVKVLRIDDGENRCVYLLLMWPVVKVQSTTHQWRSVIGEKRSQQCLLGIFSEKTSFSGCCHDADCCLFGTRCRGCMLYGKPAIEHGFTEVDFLADGVESLLRSGDFADDTFGTLDNARDWFFYE